ncbi:LLM class flavin-dependent oxidoreductase [Pseudomonas sp. CCC3.1]|uniref:LLM class flavin-dependent oxidoreductase n=1 Tax=Pseudomonas sp. CCC3.1 TaxID=3048607 RepID=UPI002AC89593|nr:LLM class flavin-dependent oxidoreductase [Pseudomonas sp. CCC3.1]MEB0203972.1 LLM class flavin-dependent oxidoreductase [Pseudomonas sp. CCC3.1]WPX37799.1 LLM class flavin-dependent oxidoreductase [Pseudomonas sp. CCC3.1]
MPLKVLWYLSFADGAYPWCPGGLYPIDFDRYRTLAQTIERGGFYGAHVATWPNDPFISASFAASYTQHLKFLISFYSRMVPAKLLAQQALTFDQLTQGRLLLNLVNGRDNIMQGYGITTSHADRYTLGIDYWRKFAFSYAQGSKTYFPNTPLDIQPQQKNGVELWGTGDSSAGVAHAGELVNVYLTMLREVDVVAEKFKKAQHAAHTAKRDLSGLGTLASIVIRPTEADALAHFYSIFETTGVEVLREKINESIVRRSGAKFDFLNFVAPDAKRNTWLARLRQRQLPTLEELRLEGNVYAGITAWSTLDVFGTGSSSAYIVGAPDSIVSTLNTYQQKAGLSVLSLSGWPLQEEAEHVAELLLPRLA